uniref:Uncharacterized protein n=1 Tax=Pithovirus LCPAC201 TaxID=2506591 RepID=A0A481Z4K8_9VIRU|nr:MAG: hypothetical protein LCPAC201_00180 [Pithovirus LCPAC201]
MKRPSNKSQSEKCIFEQSTNFDNVKVVKIDEGYDICITQSGSSELEKCLRIDGVKTKNYTLSRKDDKCTPHIEWSPDHHDLVIKFDKEDKSRNITQPCEAAYEFKRMIRCYYYDHNGKLHSPDVRIPSLIHNYSFGYWAERWHDHGELIHEIGENDVVGEFQYDYINNIYQDDNDNYSEDDSAKIKTTTGGDCKRHVSNNENKN